MRRGAYTDAREDRAGLFVRANGGTLFLDEIGEMALEAQPKLLAAIERGEVRPVGGATTTTVDVRVIAATNRPLEEAVRARTFREDLFHRLDVVRIEVPPLRERAADIPHLVDRLLEIAPDERVVVWTPWIAHANILHRDLARRTRRTITRDIEAYRATPGAVLVTTFKLAMGVTLVYVQTS